jgi:two-component system chemotaxis response regulator CheY
MPEAILLDWTMPVMTGIDFIKQLRQEPKGDQPKVVFCTTENDVERIAEAIKAGADEYMMKPFDGDILQSKFAEAGLYQETRAAC